MVLALTTSGGFLLQFSGSYFSMPRPIPPVSLSSTVKENRPAWYSGSSPGRPSSLIRTGKGKPLGELKFVNRGPNVDGSSKSGKVQILKKTVLLKDTSSSACKSRVRSPQVAAAVQNPSSTCTSRPKTRAPVVDDTPPRIKQPRLSVGTLVTPTSKIRKPVSLTVGTPRCPPSSRGREKCPATQETPTRKLKESPNATQGLKKNGSKDTAQPHSTLTCSAGRVKKTSSTPVRAPVKHLFLSPQVSKRNPKKEPLRKSFDNHGISVGSAPRKRDADCELPPAQPTNSPEIPKRGSREGSADGIRGYFGAGPMIAPEGMTLVRDRRKCKPRGTLVVGEEGLSIDSESSGVVESSIQIPLPSVASVEWMVNNDVDVGVSTNSLPDSKDRDSQVGESSRKDRSSQEISGEGFLQQLKQSSNGEFYYQHARLSQAFLQHLRQTQLSGEGPYSRSRQSHYSRDGLLWQLVQPDQSLLHDLEYEDITIDGTQGFSTDSMEVKDKRGSRDPGNREELVHSSISFNSTWAPHLEDSRRSGENARTWYAPDSSWYGFSPITPEFHRASQLPEGGSKALDALVAGSVRRRIMTDQSVSADKLETSSNSLTQSMQIMTLDDATGNFSGRSSEDTCSSFQFPSRNYADVPGFDMELLPVDTYVCQTASPIEQPFLSDGFVCSPSATAIGELCSVDCSLDASSDGVGAGALGSEDEVEYASPILGNYFSSEKPSGLSEEGTTSVASRGESNFATRTARRSSMSRTLEELMRHNFTL